jgi:hypothetical protein
MIKGELSFSSRRHGKKTIINKTKERRESGMKGRKAKKKKKRKRKKETKSSERPQPANGRQRVMSGNTIGTLNTST